MRFHSAFSVGVAFALALATAPLAHAQTTALYFDSDPGDYIGQGQTRVFSTADATFQIGRNFDNGVSLSVVSPGFGDFWWYLDFSASGNVPIAVGTYAGARRFPFAEFNGLSVSGSGRGCNTLTGWYLVREIEYSGSDVVRFAADFEQHCEDGAPALFGSIRYDSTISDLVPFGGGYPWHRLTMATPLNGRVTGGLAGARLDCGGGATTCALALQAAALVPLTATPDPGHMFGGWTGDCHGGATATVNVNGPKACSAIFLPIVPTTPRTLLLWNSHAGDYIGQGQTEVYSPWNSRWTVSMPGADRLELRIISNDTPYGSQWTISLAAPTGQVLQGGVRYAPARRFASTTDGRLDISGNGRGCNQTFGEFTLRELVVGAGNTVEQLALDFDQHCESQSSPALVGSIRFNSLVDISTMAASRTTLRFAAVTNGAAFTPPPSPQTVRLIQNGPGVVTWTATSQQPWFTVSPASGTGSATLTIAPAFASVLPPSGQVTGTVRVALSGASDSLITLSLSLRLFAPGATASPVGTVDTPLDNLTGVTGAVPFTGWALDDVEVARVTICRAPTSGEIAPASATCGGAAQIYVGDGVFIDGARPDVLAAYPAFPNNSRGGWGFMVLTNMLPNQGNGTYQFFAHAYDIDGHTTALGSRTITCANALATKPFGAIDTPGQGGVASGAAYVNFGWALTPQPKMIPIDGSTITVLVDGVSNGTVDYNHFRSDIASLFPGYLNTNGAVGFKVLDTTSLANGLHTVSWTVTDDQGAVEGIGSRFFTVSNGAGALTAADGLTATETTSAERGTSVPRRNLRATSDASSRLDRTPLRGRRGWNLTAPLETFTADREGRIVVRSEEVNRVELHVAATRGHLRTHEGLAPLPIGSRLDASTAVFTWAPGVGFVGAYDFEFVGEDGATRDVRIVLQPKGSGLVGPQVVIDAPRSQQDMGQPFVLAGWAADLDAPQGTGIATLHAWAYPLSGGPPVFLGATGYGGARPDVAALHGDQFETSGFGIVVQGLSPGHYDLAVFAWSIEQAGFAPAKVVRVTVRP